MTNLQRLVVGLVFAGALVGGAVLAIAVLGGGGGAGASPSPVAVTSPTPAAPSIVPTPTVAPTASASPAPTASPTPRPTTAPGRPTTVVVTAMRLDAENDPAGRNRRLSFRSQGAGTITVGLRAMSAQGAAVMCLSADGDRIGCKTTGSGTLTAKTTTRKADFVVTLRGASIDTPIVEVTITFPAREPFLHISNGRFDGTAYPDFNGLQAFVTPRADGDVTIDASWGGHPLQYEVDLMEQGGPGTQVLANQGPSIGVKEALPVTAGNPWKLNLQNIQEGFGTTLLDATIAWP